MSSTAFVGLPIEVCFNPFGEQFQTEEIVKVARTFLFVSALRVDQVQKALESSADEVILDLEDAVSNDDKAQARENLRVLQPARDCIVRINNFHSSDFAYDLDSITGYSWLKAVILPKVESSDDVQQTRRGLKGRTEVIALVESALGIENVKEIATSGVSRLAFGSVDYSVQMGTEPSDLLLAYPRSRLVVASAARALPPPIDGPTRNYLDLETLKAETALARTLGMGGKFCIHPKQLPIVQQCFAALPSELSWAKMVLDGLAKSPSGVFAVDGQMIDAPLIARAKEIVEGFDD
jgi:citrate lyase beta subunit